MNDQGWFRISFIILYSFTIKVTYFDDIKLNFIFKVHFSNKNKITNTHLLYKISLNKHNVYSTQSIHLGLKYIGLGHTTNNLSLALGRI